MPYPLKLPADSGGARQFLVHPDSDHQDSELLVVNHDPLGLRPDFQFFAPGAREGKETVWHKKDLVHAINFCAMLVGLRDITLFPHAVDGSFIDPSQLASLHGRKVAAQAVMKDEKFSPAKGGGGVADQAGSARDTEVEHHLLPTTRTDGATQYSIESPPPARSSAQVVPKLIT